MAISSTHGIFSESVFSRTIPQTNQKAAAAGFAQIFTTMLAKQMRQSMVGPDSGPMGISGGATGDIYGAFIDEAMGKALASSKSMKQLNKMIDRALSGPRHPINTAQKNGRTQGLQLAADTRMLRGSAASTLATDQAMSPIYTGVTMPADARGPLLLPPSPPATAPLLLPPPSEG